MGALDDVGGARLERQVRATMRRMSPKASELMEQARKLSEEERRDLAIELLDSAVAPEIEAAWTDEARRRVAEVDSGEVTTLCNGEAQRIIADD